MRILVIHGPSLNLLGKREPKIYGRRTLSEIDDMVVAYGRDRGIEVATFQSNHEGDIIDCIHTAMKEKVSAIVLNPGAYTHTSMAIADAIRSVSVPVVEVHLSNLFARGPERTHSFTTGECRGIISGFGADSYLLGIEAAARLARPDRPAREKRGDSPARRRPSKRRS